MSACRLLLLSVVRPSIEYGSEILDCNKLQAGTLESIILGELKGFSDVRLKPVMSQLEVTWALTQ